MVKCSYILGFAVLAVASSFGNLVRAETAGSGSTVKDTSAATVSLSSLGSGSVSSHTNSVTATSTSSSLANAGSKSVATATTPTATTATPTLAPASTQTPTPTPATSPTPTPTPTRVIKTGPQPISGQVTLVPGYNNCGGVGFNYTVYMPEDTSTSALTRLTCEAGYRCQDVDGSNVYTCNVWPSPDPVAFYGQCGGGNYDGQRFCAPGAVCQYISPSFSQCLPTY